MPAADRRKKLADVTPDAYDGWATFARRHGTNVTALCEIFGLYFEDLDGPLDSLPPALRRCVIAAQELSNERARRPQA